MSPTPLLQLPPGQAKNHLLQAQSDAPVNQYESIMVSPSHELTIISCQKYNIEYESVIKTHYNVCLRLLSHLCYIIATSKLFLWFLAVDGIPNTKNQIPNTSQ